MKFIFPQNYHLSSKFLGIIDYSTAIFNICCWVIFFFVSHFLFHDLMTSIIFFILFCFPILLLSIIGFNHENFLYVLGYLIRYYKRPKLYLYRK